MKKIVILPLVLCSIVACQAGSNASGEKAENPQSQTTQSQATDNKEKGVWIDVRSADEYNAGHLSGAINIVHTDIASKIATVVPNKDEPIHLYCRSGNRANIALKALKDMGYTNVTNHGGYDDLVKQGLR